MVEMMNYFLEFFYQAVQLLFSIVSIDGYSFGYMILGALIVSMIIAGTIGAVGIVTNNMRRSSMSRRYDSGGDE